jgi:hypothetical protein
VDVLVEVPVPLPTLCHSPLTYTYRVLLSVSIQNVPTTGLLGGLAPGLAVVDAATDDKVVDQVFLE